MFVPSALVGVRGHIWGARYVVRQLQTAELLSEGVADMHLPDGSAFMAAHNTWVLQVIVTHWCMRLCHCVAHSCTFKEQADMHKQ